MSHEPAPEALGRAIAKRRADAGLTQQDLADRIGISRTGLSHIEAGMREPGERTVTLLAGVFKLEPHELVAGTDYPVAKADRLPLVTTHHTAVDHLLGVLAAETALLDRMGIEPPPGWRDEWSARLREHLATSWHPGERERLEQRLDDFSA